MARGLKQKRDIMTQLEFAIRQIVLVVLTKNHGKELDPRACTEIANDICCDIANLIVDQDKERGDQ